MIFDDAISLKCNIEKGIYVLNHYSLGLLKDLFVLKENVGKCEKLRETVGGCGIFL